MKERSVSLSPRLAYAAEQLRGANVVADIGCDHGRLAVALIQRQCCTRVIAVDSSAPSFLKAGRLIAYVGLSHAIETRLGDGFSAITPGACDATALLGMGGILITELLDACSAPLNGAKRAVFQPMRGQEALRRYLWEREYRITDDRIVREGLRFYQVITVEPPEANYMFQNTNLGKSQVCLTGIERQALPEGWPPDCFELGFVSFAQRDPLLPELAQKLLAQYEKQLAGARGSSGEAALAQKAERMRQIIGACQIPS